MKRLKLGGTSAFSSEAELTRHRESVILVTEAGCAQIKARPGLARQLDADNVLKLMSGLVKGDKLPPIGAAPTGELIYGAHRLMASQLLATQPQLRRKTLHDRLLSAPLTDAQKLQMERFSAVPSVELRVDVVNDPEAEIRENTHRRQLTPELVREQLDLLVSFGYEEGSGRPSKDSKGKAMLRLADLWGVTPRALQQHLQKLQPAGGAEKKKPAPKADAAELSRARLRRALTSFLEANSNKRTKASREVQELAEQLAARLDV